MAFAHDEPSPGFDATTLLTIYVCLLLAIPSAMVVRPLGSAGAPSAIFAVGTFFLWSWFQVRRNSQADWGRQPVRSAALGWMLIMVVVYAHAMSSPMPYDEISPADNGMLKLAGLTGILLVANDGIPTLQRHHAALRRLVIGVGLVAFFGLLQYAAYQLFVDRLRIPGLTPGTIADGLIVRNGHPRPSGTSTHPIEYGVVLTMVMPIAITYALKSPTHRWLYKVLVLAISFAIFLSLSRSALVCAAVAFVVLFASWGAAVRIRALSALLAIALVIFVFVPGVLGTTARLFTGASDDPSIASRTGSYHLAGEFISRSPFLGRGFGTFLPKYWILDNGYLGLLIEAGIIGVVGLLVLIVAAIFAARNARRMAVEEFDRDIAQALLASIASGAAGLAFFDTFGFPQSAGCFFLILGSAGALRRLTGSQTGGQQSQANLAPARYGSSVTSEGAQL